jgi:hypothetical protein
MFRADPGEMGNLVFGKSLLIGLYCDHFPAVLLRFPQTFRKAGARSKVDHWLFSEQSFCRLLNSSFLAMLGIGKLLERKALSKIVKGG